METVLGRYRNLIVLVGILFAQVVGLAVQVKRTTETESSLLIRVWAVHAVTPLEKGLGWVQTSSSSLWRNYLYLRGVRAENRDLKQQLEQLHIEQARLKQDADQAQRLQSLLAFRQQYISETLAAQVIGSSGSDQSHSVYIDKGAHDGLKPDMAVITLDGVVGKVLRVFPYTSLVLLIDDPSSGVGVILDKARLQGVLRGTPAGEITVERVMADEQVPVGEKVLTSGGDQIFVKGLPVGTVTQVKPGAELFLSIHVRPAANLDKLEEVLVVTKKVEKQAEPGDAGPVRASDILALRLPSVPLKDAPNAGDVSAEKSPSDSGKKPIPPAKSQPSSENPPR